MTHYGQLFHTYTVVAHPRVSKALKCITSSGIKERILEAIEDLKYFPLSLIKYDVEKIKGSKINPLFRIRIGRYRIVFHINKAERTAYVIDIFMK